MKQSYHHGDLKQALIEKGLEYIGAHGTESLSLRKLAALCDVSNAAPYAHFKDKEELLQAIHCYIMEQFTDVLQICIGKYKGSPALLCELGCEYVMFFREHPLYYTFLFSPEHSDMKIYAERDREGNIPPFEIFKAHAYEMTDSMGIPEKDAQNKITAMWALVHGLAAITALGGSSCASYGREEVKNILMSVKVM